jgi:hypothetical protein
MKKLTILVFAALLTTFNAVALEDTPENRRIQAARYAEVSPLEDLLLDAAQKGAMNLPPADRQMFVDLLTKHLDIDTLKAQVNEIMVEHFTADELKALADFYGSDVGRSALNKFGAYMADAMPVLQAELMKAQAKANREMESPEQ